VSVVGYHVCGLDDDALAEHTGKMPATVRQARARGRKKLRALLGSDALPSAPLASGASLQEASQPASAEAGPARRR
jgi:hypothetical protein